MLKISIIQILCVFDLREAQKYIGQNYNIGTINNNVPNQPNFNGENFYNYDKIDDQNERKAFFWNMNRNTDEHLEPSKDVHIVKTNGVFLCSYPGKPGVFPCTQNDLSAENFSYKDSSIRHFSNSSNDFHNDGVDLLTESSFDKRDRSMLISCTGSVCHYDPHYLKRGDVNHDYEEGLLEESHIGGHLIRNNLNKSGREWREGSTFKHNNKNCRNSSNYGHRRMLGYRRGTFCNINNERKKLIFDDKRNNHNEDIDKEIMISHYIQKYKNAMPKNTNLDKNPMPKIECSLMNFSEISNKIKTDKELLNFMIYKDASTPYAPRFIPNINNSFSNPRHDTWENYTYLPADQTVLKLSNNPDIYLKNDPDFETKKYTPIYTLREFQAPEKKICFSV